MNNGGKELCEDCQQGYAIVYQAMSEYLPDESVSYLGFDEKEILMIWPC